MDMRGTYYPLKKYATKYDYPMTNRAINTHERKKCECDWYVIEVTAQTPMINSTMIYTHEQKYVTRRMFSY